MQNLVRGALKFKQTSGSAVKAIQQKLPTKVSNPDIIKSKTIKKDKKKDKKDKKHKKDKKDKSAKTT